MQTRPPQRRSIGEPLDGDGQDGQWPQQRLVSMNEKFCRRVERAIARGQERKPEPDGGER